MTPEVVKSLPPIRVTALPGPDWLSAVGIFAAVFAAAFSGLAVFIALKTLGKIDEQLDRADKQLDLACKELRAVKDDFALSQKQFDLSQKQFREVMRRPDLSVSMNRYGDTTALDTFPDGNRPRIVSLYFFVTNNGDAVARDVFLEIFVQQSHLAATGQPSPGMPGLSLTNAIGSVRHIDGIKYMQFGFKKPLGDNVVIYSMGHTLTFEGTFLIEPRVPQMKILWRVFDQYSGYPKEGEGPHHLGAFPPLSLVGTS